MILDYLLTSNAEKKNKVQGGKNNKQLGVRIYVDDCVVPPLKCEAELYLAERLVGGGVQLVDWPGLRCCLVRIEASSTPEKLGNLLCISCGGA